MVIVHMKASLMTYTQCLTLKQVLVSTDVHADALIIDNRIVLLSML